MLLVASGRRTRLCFGATHERRPFVIAAIGIGGTATLA